MTATSANVSQGSLPRLSGRLLRLYRIIWCALAIGAVVATALAALQYAAEPAVVGLRLVKSGVLLSVAAILLYRRHRDPVAALLALAFLSWTITSSFDFGTHEELAQLLDRGRFLLFALALLLFPDGRWHPQWTRIVAAASVGVFLLGVGEILHLLPTRLFLPLAIACVLAGIGSLVARFRTSTSYALKQQLKWVALGSVTGVGLILFARAGSAASTSHIATIPVLWEGLFQLGIIIVALGFLVSLLRYRLFDAEAVISRSAAYATLTIALVATFGGTEAAIQNLGQEYLGMNIGSISGAMAAAVAAVLLSPLHGRISDWAESRFQPDLARLKREMPEVLARISAKSSVRRLCAEALSHINVAIHATRSAFLLESRIVSSVGITDHEGRGWVHTHGTNPPERDQSDLIFPVRLRLRTTDVGGVAWLLLGPRPDGTLYGREELDAVRSIFPALEQALTATFARQSVNEAIRRRERRVRTELADLRANLRAVQLLLENGKQSHRPLSPFLNLPSSSAAPMGRQQT